MSLLGREVGHADCMLEDSNLIFNELRRHVDFGRV